MNVGIVELVIVFSIVVVLLFLATLIGTILLRFTKPKSALPTTPLDHLKARYARGEINREQFERLKKELA